MKLTKNDKILIYSALHITLTSAPIHLDHMPKLKALMKKFKESIDEEA